jgi:hypothetical protein
VANGSIDAVRRRHASPVNESLGQMLVARLYDLDMKNPEMEAFRAARGL